MKDKEFTDRLSKLIGPLEELLSLLKELTVSKEPVKKAVEIQPLPVKKELSIETNPVEKIIEIHNAEFDKLVKLLMSEDWPEAVDSLAICNQDDESHKIERAEGIIDSMILTDLTGKNFLDFGCGQGHVVAKIMEMSPKTAVGYDIHQTGVLPWEKDDEEFLLTTDFNKVISQTYDVILLHDVVDHLEGSIKEVFARIRQLLAPGGVVYVRCHPWCGRHGGHTYLKYNKAFVHLVFTEPELNKLEIPKQTINKVTHPLVTYDKWFGEKFAIERSDMLKQPIETFFRTEPLIYNRIIRHWQGSNDQNAKIWPNFQLEQVFIDYALRAKQTS